jgi:phage tail sheath protein FI
MPQYLAPGVYIEEVQTGPPPIAGVGTSTPGFVGVTRRGPIEGPATLVTSYADFVRTFGGAFDFGATFAGLQDLPPAIRGFFDNGGQTAFVARVAPAVAGSTAAATLTGGLITRLMADTVPTQDTARLRDLRGISAKTATQPGTKISLQMIQNGVTTAAGPFTVTAINRDTGVVTLDAVISATVAFGASVTTVFTDLASAPQLDGDGLPEPLALPTDAKPDSFELEASSPGTWGAAIQIVPAAESAARATIVALASGAAGDNQLQLNSTAGFYPGAWVEVDTGATKRYRTVLGVSGPIITLDGTALTAAEVAADPGFTGARVSTCEFGLTISYADPVEHVTVQENYHGLTLANIPGRYYSDQLAASALVTVTGAAPADTNPFLFPSAPDGITAALTGGVDSVPSDQDVLGYDNGPNQKSGLLAIQDVDQVAILAAPGLTNQVVQQGLIDQCELLLDRFAVLDPVPGTGGNPATLPQIEAQRNLYDSEYAALYYPGLVIADPLATTTAITATPPTRVIAPSGHVLGVYARVDQTRGVHKAPANELVQGILAIQTVVSKGTQEILNPLNINVIRDLSSMQRGLRIYGARCTTSDTDWNYVNVRRLFIFIEKSLDIGTQWVVFEPNDEKLWAQVKDSVSLFLTGVWRDGALMGAKAEQAFFVTVDRTTMTDDDILNGRLIMEIGIAPVRPAEFVVIRIGQWLGGSSVQVL